MEFANVLKSIVRGWWIISLTTLTAIAIALILSFIATPIYRASASFVVSPNKAIIPNQNLVDSLGTLDKRSIIATYAEVVNSTRIYTEATAALQMDPNEARIYTHNAVVLPDANVLVLSVTGPDPQKTAVLATSIGPRGISYIKGLYQAYDINLLDPAIPPTSPSSPQPLRDTGLALVLGVVLGTLLALLGARMRLPLAEYSRQTRSPGTTQYSRQIIPRR